MFFGEQMVWRWETVTHGEINRASVYFDWGGDQVDSLIAEADGRGEKTRKTVTDVTAVRLTPRMNESFIYCICNVKICKWMYLKATTEDKNSPPRAFVCVNSTLVQPVCTLEAWFTAATGWRGHVRGGGKCVQHCVVPVCLCYQSCQSSQPQFISKPNREADLLMAWLYQLFIMAECLGTECTTARAAQPVHYS